MKEGNKQFLYAIMTLVGINVLINILPPPFGFIAMGGVLLWFLYDLYNKTRY